MILRKIPHIVNLIHACSTLKDAARAGGKILPPDVIVGVLYHNSFRSAYERSLEKEDGCWKSSKRYQKMLRASSCREDLSSERPLTMSTVANMVTILSRPSLWSRSKELKV